MINPLIFYRIGNFALKHKIPIIPKVLRRLCVLVCGADIPMGCSIGKNVQFGHFGLGVVINDYTTIKDNVIIYHGVTLGRSRGINDTTVNTFKHIYIGKNTLIGAHAVILAKEERYIGENSEIGAGAVVLCDVPDKSIAVGNPARVFPRKNNDS